MGIGGLSSSKEGCWGRSSGFGTDGTVEGEGTGAAPRVESSLGARSAGFGTDGTVDLGTVVRGVVGVNFGAGFGTAPRLGPVGIRGTGAVRLIVCGFVVLGFVVPYLRVVCGTTL
tara:strand:- start:5860 stop:6204 length:345 start_codon:yes stop_codon:yes gene_type:complete